MLCTMLLCISVVSFGSDDATTKKEPDKVSVIDIDYSIDIVSIEKIVSAENYGLKEPIMFVENVSISHYIKNSIEILNVLGNYISIPEKLTSSNHVGKLILGSFTKMYTRNFNYNFISKRARDGLVNLDSNAKR